MKPSDSTKVKTGCVCHV